jgi:hypothetical protein
MRDRAGRSGGVTHNVVFPSNGLVQRIVRSALVMLKDLFWRSGPSNVYYPAGAPSSHGEELRALWRRRREGDKPARGSHDTTTLLTAGTVDAGSEIIVAILGI